MSTVRCPFRISTMRSPYATVQVVFHPLALRTLTMNASSCATQPRPGVLSPAVCQSAESFAFPAISFWKPLSSQGVLTSSARK